MTRTVLRGGYVIKAGAEPQRADLALDGGLIAMIGTVHTEPDDVVVDCADRLIMPGLIDTHSHADGQVFDEEVAFALLRQGVTTVIAGQDGVSFAPGDGLFASRYFAAINGTHPSYVGASVADLLSTYDNTTPINVGYLVPAGTVREMIMGLSPEPATAEQINAMQEVVSKGMVDGALGLSTGLDYVPGLFADAEEITALCRPVAAAGGIYVTHMRGGYEENSAAGLDEVINICAGAGVRGHVSHFHARSEMITELVEQANTTVDLTFDSYPYSRGCTLLGMLLLPPELLRRGLDVCASQLLDPQLRRETAAGWVDRLQARADMGPQWADHVRFAHIAASGFDWAHGLSVAEAARTVGTTPGELGLQVLAESGLEVSVVMATPVERSDEEMAVHLGHPRHMGGSDGIFIGRSPHPRGWGAFGRYLDVFVRRGDLSWGQCVERFSAAPARRFGLGRRGSLQPGAVADVIVVDPQAVQVRASYAEPRRPMEGIDDIWVSGVRVLDAGRLVSRSAGRGLRHSGLEI
ncbi:MAG: N-acyl-D-aspartate/D-glutamate deacylase [Propionibacteriaceae bacterium]|jgi:N-acyl-D-amino-acid deacylase|nr:N-acyl-D-aspartate/D-glutamate deacylase [Propionibacteriaceae bacterium]